MSGKYSCFSHSSSEKYFFCAPCDLFGTASEGGISLNRLVISLLQSYCHLTGRDGYLTTHLAKYYHKDSCYKATLFEKMAAGIETSSYEQLNHAAKRAKQKIAQFLNEYLKRLFSLVVVAYH